MGSLCCCDKTTVVENDFSDVNPLMNAEITPTAYPETLISQTEDNHEDDYRKLTNNILKDTENLMVSANVTDQPLLDQTEYDDRHRFYSHRIKNIHKNFPSQPVLARAQGNPNNLMQHASLTQQDIDQMRQINSRCSELLNKMIQSDCEQLIVEFEHV